MVSTPQGRVLLIDDDPDIALLLSFHLSEIGLDLQVEVDGTSGLARGLNESFDLLIVDLMLPKLDGFEVCKQLRGGKIHAPILMLTSRSEEVDKVLGLEFGADDYLTKPFGVRELIARIRALLRRASLGAEGGDKSIERIAFPGLEILPSKRAVSVRGAQVELTAKEFDLLLLLASSPGHIFTRAALLDRIWDYHSSSYDHTVTSHINRLRSKIERDPETPQFILTVWGVGYKFSEAP
jgi:two-component system alkaline phosphatase synthesis response regulator PhoP